MIGVEMYNPRMYPLKNCHNYASGTLYIYSGTTFLNAIGIADYCDFNFVKYDNLAAGTYTLKVIINWDKTFGDFDVKDYTVKVYASQIVTIKQGTLTGKYNYIMP